MRASRLYTHVYIYIYCILDCANVCRFSCPYTYPPPRLRDWRGKSGGVPLVYMFLFRLFCASARLTVCRLSGCLAASSVLLTVLFYCSFLFLSGGVGVVSKSFHPLRSSPTEKTQRGKSIKTTRERRQDM